MHYNLIKVKESQSQISGDIMKLSDKIEAFILSLLSEDDDWIELRRNELAAIFNCVPSQINYVLATRFNQEHGYETESRRGGGGYLRIRRIHCADDKISYYIGMIGSDIDAGGANAVITSITKEKIIDGFTSQIIAAAVCDRSIPVNQPYKNKVRAAILKNILIKINDKEDKDNV